MEDASDKISQHQADLIQFKHVQNWEIWREQAKSMVDFIADYYQSLDTTNGKNSSTIPVKSQVEPGYLHKLLPIRPPDTSESFQDVLADVKTKILPGITHWQHPSFFAYFSANSSVPASLGAMLSTAFNVIGFSWVSSPACTELETIVMDWLAHLLQLPSAFFANPPDSTETCIPDKMANSKNIDPSIHLDPTAKPHSDATAETSYSDSTAKPHSDSTTETSYSDSTTKTPRAGTRGGGIIQGTASEAVAVAMIAARHRAIEAIKQTQIAKGNSHTEAHDYAHQASLKFVAYTSDQAHSCVKKACIIAGLPVETNFRCIPTKSTQISMDAIQCASTSILSATSKSPTSKLDVSDMKLSNVSYNYAMDPEILKTTIETDITNGYIPIFVCASIGTTSSGAFDPLIEIGQICQSFPHIWMHIDAAWAGAACICPEYRPLLNGVEYADSFDFNPHKWLLTNFDCSALFVKHRKYLFDALSLTPEYLRSAEYDKGLVVDYRDLQIPLGRTFRSLKLWFVLRMFGTNALRAFIREHCAIAHYFADLIRQDERFELVTPISLGLVCFRLKANDTVNEKMLEIANASGRLFMVHTKLEGKFVLRCAIGNPRTSRIHVQEAYDILCDAAKKALLQVKEENHQ